MSPRDNWLHLGPLENGKRRVFNRARRRGAFPDPLPEGHKAVNIGKTKFHPASDVQVDERTGLQEETALAVRLSQQLAHEAIDAEVRKRIGEGFTHKGKVFSLSENAQRNWAMLLIQTKGTSKVVNLIVSTIDDSSVHVVQDADEVQAIADQIQEAILKARAWAHPFKAAVRAAKSIKDVDAVLETLP